MDQNKDMQLSFTGFTRDMELKERLRGHKSRLYVSIKDENMLENLLNRRNRPVAEYKKLLAPVFKMLDTKARWSQTAGCSCGCSPGFILDRPVRVAGQGLPQTFWITITGAAKNDGSQRDIIDSLVAQGVIESKPNDLDQAMNKAFGV